MARLNLLARGKINLILDVVRRRNDGYHEVAMVMQSVSVGDQMFLETHDENKIVLSTSDPTLGTGSENLAYRAAALLQNTYGIKQGVGIHIEKKIPVAAGLGGGSADAAGILVGLNHLWQIGLSDKELCQIGLKLGADVPFCIKGGAALAEGVGERLTALPPVQGCRLVLVKPSFPVSTAEVYQAWDQIDSPPHPDVSKVAELLRNGDYRRIPEVWGNALEAATFTMRPEVKKLWQELREQALNVRMSGSGPTLFIWDLPSEPEAERIAAACRQTGVWAEALQTESEGIIFYHE